MADTTDQDLRQKARTAFAYFQNESNPIFMENAGGSQVSCFSVC
jgi:hypothetical protein